MGARQCPTAAHILLQALPKQCQRGELCLLVRLCLPGHGHLAAAYLDMASDPLLGVQVSGRMDERSPGPCPYPLELSVG